VWHETGSFVTDDFSFSHLQRIAIKRSTRSFFFFVVVFFHLVLFFGSVSVLFSYNRLGWNIKSTVCVGPVSLKPKWISFLKNISNKKEDLPLIHSSALMEMKRMHSRTNRVEHDETAMTDMPSEQQQLAGTHFCHEKIRGPGEWRNGKKERRQWPRDPPNFGPFHLLPPSYLNLFIYFFKK
jgi:hypothetical protein